MNGVPNEDQLMLLKETIVRFHTAHDRDPGVQELSDILGVPPQIAQEWLMWFVAALYVEQRELDKRA